MDVLFKKAIPLLSLILLVCSAGVQGASPIRLDVNIHTMGGNVRGFGVLAEYSAASPGKVVLTRTTKPGAFEFKPDYGGFASICSFKIYDPQGKVVQFFDLGAQKTEQARYEFSLPAGNPGVWRFSVANGLGTDSYQIEFPETPVWGVRGEMALGIRNAFPKEMFLYVPEQAELLIAMVWGAKEANIELFDGTKLLGAPKPAGNRKLITLDRIPKGKAVKVVLNNMKGAALAFDGVPGLLCPTPEAALKLKGGQVKASGFFLNGPIQANVRKVMAEFKPDDFQFTLKYPPYEPQKIRNPQLECLLFGRYGPLGTLVSASEKQILDSSSPFFGANTKLDNKNLKDWRKGIYGGVISPFSAESLAAAAETPLSLNPLYRNRAIINRSLIAAFYHLVQLQGDGILREGDLRRNDYPMTHSFFVYDNLAKTLDLLKNDLTPAQREAYRDALIELGDKIAAYQAYESNQWGHVISGHLNTYKATGEARFKRYFEILMGAYVNCTFGKDSKHGLHPTGFFLEEYGPDGNYDHLNMYALASAYYRYRALPDADPELVRQMRDGIQRNLYYKSFHWLPSAGNNPDFIFTPNAMNCRTNSLVSIPSYPGDYMAGREFDLGYTRFMMNRPVRPDVAYPASVFPHLANTDEWALTLIREDLRKGPRASQADDYFGGWTPELYDVYKLPLKAKVVELPYQKKSGMWDLPGQIAWKRGELYGIIFYAVDGANRKWEPRGIMSGGPLGLWSRELGYALASMRNSRINAVLDNRDITWSGVYGTLPNGKIVYSGKEHSDFKWIRRGSEFEITASLRPVKGTLAWTYTIRENGVKIRVKLNAPELRDAVLSLPFRMEKEVSMNIERPGEFVYRRGKSSMTVTWPADRKAFLSGKLETSHKEIPVNALRIPFPENGVMDLTITVK